MEDEYDNTTESGPESPRSDMKLASTSSSKRSKRGARKRVVSIPIKEVEGGSLCRLKGDISSPPADSWAWRKYGQKPIKGSPYPRGYYRCSSSKGCPARKQVERSHVDPTTLVVTYSSDHNHSSPPPPPSRSHHHNPKSSTVNPPANPEPEPESDRVASFGDEQLILSTESWFGEIETTSSAILDSRIFADDRRGVQLAVDVFSPMREEDELLFADLGELPECTAVFRRTEVQIC